MLRPAAVLGCLLLVVALVPAAAEAQVGEPPMRLTVEAPAVPIQRGSEAFVNAMATLSCSAVLAATDPRAPQEGTTIQIEFEAPEGVVFAGEGNVHVDTEDCVTGSLQTSVTASFLAAMTSDVRGLVPLPVVAKAHLVSTTAAGAAEAEVTFSLTAAAHLYSEAMTAAKLKMCSCDRLPYDIQITNFGNVPASYEFSLASEPSGGWSAELPASLVIEPGATGTAVLVLHLAGGNSEGAFTLAIDSHATDDPAAKDKTLTVTVLARHRVILSAPAIPAPMLGLFLLATGTLARRRA
ncbi:MAG TPA: hypothetical protein VM327_04710 [Candidatus Thermoplasmatota archaeon]|nr:hypothetical protein [Candidatus Thermoplasmatota archaeon]